MPLLIGVAVAGCVVLLFAGIRLVVDQPVAERFEELELRRAARRRRRPNPVSGLVDLVGQGLAPTVLGLVGTSQRARWDALLDSAGRPAGLNTTVLAARKGGYSLLLALAGVPMALGGSWWAPPVFAVLGFFLPDLALRSEARERQEQINRALPDFLDVLAVTVSAGLDFRSALGRVAEAFDGPLSDEVRTALRQMMLGESRREALDGLRRRNDSESLSEFVTALQQAEDLGAPLTTALGGIAGDVRHAYGQQARREAAKVEPRLSVLLTVTLIPAALIIIAVGFYLTSDIDLGTMLGG